MKPALYLGTIAHKRYIPREHQFRYPFFMWFLNLDHLHELPCYAPWFSTIRPALARFKREDYYGEKKQPLADSIRERLAELTGEAVQGEICALLNMRTMGIYFSPVNFYFGYDQHHSLSHFLAEVSNTPWNERHQYGYLIEETGLNFTAEKAFHVSPFNHLNQEYHWQLTEPGLELLVQLGVADQRGQVFEAVLNLRRTELTKANIIDQIRKKPAMAMTILSRIYWQALRIFAKKIPYVPYKKENA